MSIIINGMDMPKGNSTKNLLIYSDGRVFTGHKDDVNYFAEEQTWIPVAERLPEQRERVLTCSKDEDVWINDFNPIAPTAWAIEPWAVIAWMPLPKPWKGEGDE